MGAKADQADHPDISVFRPDRPGIRKVLGDLEADIMEVVWARRAGQGTTVRDVFEVLYDRRRAVQGGTIAYTTVMNTMARLARKHILHTEKADQAYVYFPTLSQDEFVSRFVGRILEELLVSFSGPTLERIDALTDPKAAARARALLDEIARRRTLEDAHATSSTEHRAQRSARGRAGRKEG
jgi:predicted transcriptional regulator